MLEDIQRVELIDIQDNRVYLTMGEYDLILICEASDDAVMARFVMQLGALGFVRTRTVKAFPESAYREIIASLR